jgi:CheY-like chemotaxis protein
MIRVLLVDDDAVTRGRCAHALSVSGCKVVAMESGRSALTALRIERFDVLVTDLVMPGMDGHELIRAVRAFDPKLCIIAMSGRARRGLDLLPTANALGADAALEKPFAPIRLIDLVRRMLA